MTGRPVGEQTHGEASEQAVKPWDSDHTALVHVLWDARLDGLTVEAADELAQHIMRSEWMRAVRVHCREDQTRQIVEAVDALPPHLLTAESIARFIAERFGKGDG